MVSKKTSKKSTRKSTKKSVNTSSKKATKKSASKKSPSKKTSKKSTAKSSSKDYSSTPKTPKIVSEKESELDKVIAQLPKDEQGKLIDIKNIVERFKDKIVTRLEGYVSGVSLLPPSKDEKDKEDSEKINVLVLIDDYEAKKMSKEELSQKIKTVCDQQAKTVSERLHVEPMLLTELWQHCYDSKTEPLQMIAMSAIVYDTGMLSAIKISEVHKSLVLKKFEKYIVSYVLSGSMTQGRSTPESDVDVFVVIDDTDVKKMTRAELRDKLRAIIIQMGGEAAQMTGIQKDFNIQVYILTDFWESIKDASPVIFTFLRDGVPFYDRGVFMPWKQLLQMGRIKPSPEAIDMYLGSGKQFVERIELKMKEIAMEDFYWGIITPSQAALMMYGIPPTTPRETSKAMRDLLVKKEKLLEPEYVDIFDEIFKIHKDFEHKRKLSITGKEIDDLLDKSKRYLDRLEKLFEEIRLHKEEEKVIHMYENMVTVIRDVLRLEGITSVEEKNLISLFTKHVVEKGFIPQRYTRMVKDMVKAKKDYDAGKLSKQDVNLVTKDSKELTAVLVEHIQRKQNKDLEKTRIKVKYGNEQFGEVVLLGDDVFIITDINDDDKRRVSRGKVSESGEIYDRVDISLDEFENALVTTRAPPQLFVKGAFFEYLKNIFGPDLEIFFAK
ncbi:MAG: nucleotidyltransferase domain-containing protein [Candidatus Woesearchaeota archaeon]